MHRVVATNCAPYMAPRGGSATCLFHGPDVCSAALQQHLPPDHGIQLAGDQRLYVLPPRRRPAGCRGRLCRLLPRMGLCRRALRCRLTASHLSLSSDALDTLTLWLMRRQQGWTLSGVGQKAGTKEHQQQLSIENADGSLCASCMPAINKEHKGGGVCHPDNRDTR
jgi:hypothetical protein